MVVEVKVPKSYEYQDLILKECLDCLEEDSIPNVNVSVFNISVTKP